MKKRILSIMITSLICLSFIGCGANSTNETATQEDAFVGGTWGTNSISGENENYPASYYVQFTDSAVNYGHMTDDGKFEIEYSDKIVSIKEISSGIYRVQAESDNGSKFTYQTNEDDNTIMDYYSTWDESEYDDNYSASYSLSKCQ